MQYDFDFSQTTLADYIAFCAALTEKDNPARAISMYFSVIEKTIDLSELSVTELQPVFEAFVKELTNMMSLVPIWGMICVR